VNPTQLSEYVSIFLALFFLAVAAISDMETREVSDKVWLGFGPIGLALTVYRTYTDPSLLILTAVSIGFSILVAFGLVFFGLSGGADAKALMCLGLTLPLAPSVITPVLGYPHPFFPIVILVTGYICSFSVAIWMLGNNITKLIRLKSQMFEGLEHERVWKKALAMITGFPTELGKLQSTFYLYPMEKVLEDERGARRTLQVYSVADVDRQEVLSEFTESLGKVGSPTRVWVTPGLPMLVFILFALVITLTVGDLVFGGIFLLLKH
jgi:prepilin signal peptidase PulO-like enzyme (type II secretory pathway)